MRKTDLDVMQVLLSLSFGRKLDCADMAVSLMAPGRLEPLQQPLFASLASWFFAPFSFLRRGGGRQPSENDTPRHICGELFSRPRDLRWRGHSRQAAEHREQSFLSSGE